MFKPPIGYYVPVTKSKSAWFWHYCAHCGSRMQWEDSFRVVTPLSLSYPDQYDRDHHILRGYITPISQDICMSCAERVLGTDPLHLKPEALQTRVEGFFDLPEPQVVQVEVGTSSLARLLGGLSLGESRQSRGGAPLQPHSVRND